MAERYATEGRCSAAEIVDEVGLSVWRWMSEEGGKADQCREGESRYEQDEREYHHEIDHELLL